MLTLALLAQLALVAPQKVVVPPLKAGSGVQADVATSLSEAVVAELRRRGDWQVISYSELSAVLANEATKEHLGCDSDACFAELGGAVGADRLVAGNVARLGDSWLIYLKLIDVKNVSTLAQADRRLKGGKLDDVLDALPQLVQELLGAKGAKVAVSQASHSTAPIAASPAPQGAVDELAPDSAAIKNKVQLLTDGKGHYIAVADYGTLDAPLYAGTETALWAQRIIGSSRNGDKFDYTFWDPRVGSGWQRSFGKREGGFELMCGDTKIAFTPVSTKKVLEKATLYLPRWRRQLHALARDENGIYYLVDQSRERGKEDDLRLFVGRKNKLVYVPVEDAMMDRAGSTFFSAQGKLILAANKASWVDAQGEHALVPLVVEDEARFAYGKLGVYANEQLGTPCDDFAGN